MTDNTQELDEILGHWIKGYINGSAGGFYVTNQTKQDILDWHNKQVEEAVREARVDELRHIVSGSGYSVDDFYWYEKTEDEYVGNRYYSEVYHLTKGERITELYKESKNE